VLPPWKKLIVQEMTRKLHRTAMRIGLIARFQEAILNAGGNKVERRRATYSTRADDEHAR
jgi:hypothetical protein